ncbi:proteasome regulatory particle subunit [Parelaphostrongylus tenuis]|uniref:Proteasome regulatory particle subunit n=1 Tax=Parelaphostrongylus tenuis TaxID=148309 RepID=A0AAD5MNM7_PARTN|nr:proteasome regulatory particle subunit [Parelaphostrongylus tenuis]
MQRRLDRTLLRVKSAKSLQSSGWEVHGRRSSSFYTRKLWHQLTQEVRAAQANPAFTTTLNQKEFYDGFISEFEHRINALQLVEIVLPIAKYIFKPNKDKVALARIHAGQIELRLNHKDEGERLVDIKKVRDLIELTRSEIDNFVGVTEAHAPFYKVSAMYLKEIGDFAGYYREALRYLGVEDIGKMTARWLRFRCRKLMGPHLSTSALIARKNWGKGIEPARRLSPCFLILCTTNIATPYPVPISQF